MNDPSSKTQRDVLKEAIGALERMQKKLELYESGRREPLAIIGMACRYPGHANDPEAFWQLLHNGVDAIEDTPASRWDSDAYFDPDPEVPGKMCTRHGGFVDDMDQFDPQFFGISPREAVSMDPQHRLALQVTWEALENAAQAPAGLLEKRVGVFLGITTRDYAQRLTYDGFDNLDAYGLTGNLSCFAAGRISYILGVQGVSFAVDTACSSSLVAMNVACQSLRTGESDMVLTGGVNLLLWPEISVTESKAHMLTPDGRCKTFDASADGFVRAEGCGILVIKRLSDAIANGDNILALVKGWYSNHDGASSGLTVPNPRAQQAVVEGALQCAGIKPGDVDFVETHGTGTSLGDPIELGALAAVFGKDRDKKKPLMIGSVKTNIGHLESAAGVASVMKVVLALRHEEIPPHLHFKNPTPHLQWDQAPFVVPTKSTPWCRSSRPRIAGVSSFGASGTNAHVILEEAPVPKSGEQVDRPLHVLAISAKSEKALAALAGKYAREMERDPAVRLPDIAFTANVGRNHFAYRRAFVGERREEMIDQLRAFAAGEKKGIGADSPVRNSERPKVAFLFTGQGAQHVNMGQRLYATEPVFRAAIDRCNEVLAAQLEPFLIAVLYPGQDHESPLDQTRYTQPALFAVEYALAELWRSWGIGPDAVLGHSIGEYAAACAAGVFSLEDGLKLVGERGRLMQELPAGGAMAAVFSSEDAFRDKLNGCFDRVEVAAVNGPESLTVSGPREQLEEAVRVLGQKGVQSRLLNVSHAFHSSLMEPMLATFEESALSVGFAAPRVPFVSTVEGRFFGSGEVPDAAYWRRQARTAVRFADGMEALHQKGFRIFLELGPDAVLTGMARRFLSAPENVWLPSLKAGRDDLAQMLESLAGLHVRGVCVDWKGFDRGRERRRVALPTYAFEQKRFCVEPPPPLARRGRSPASGSSGYPGHPLLQSRFRSPLVAETVYEGTLELANCRLFEDLKIHGIPVLSSAGVIELAQAAARDFYRTDAFAVCDLALQHALAATSDRGVRVQCVVRADDDHHASVEIISLGEQQEPTTDQAWVRHATARITNESGERSKISLPALKALRAVCDREVAPDEHYERLSRLGFDYGDSLRGIEELRVGPKQALALVRMTPVVKRERRSYVFHPGMLDACLQAFPAVWGATDPQNIFLPVGIEEISYFTEPTEHVWSCATVTSAKEDSLAGDLQILNESEQPVAHLKGVTFVRVTEEGLRRSVGGAARAVSVAAPAHARRIDIRKRLSEAPPPQRSVVLLEWVRDTVARVMRVTPPESLDTRAALTSLGLDSLMAMELRSSVRSALHVEVELGDILAGPTVEEWSQVLLGAIAGEGTPSGGESPENARETATAELVSSATLDSAQAQDLLKNLDRLTDGEVERVLQKMTSAERSA